MGSGTSKRPEDKAQEVLTKLSVVNALDSRPVKPPPHRSNNLHEYLQKRKQEKELELQEENSKESSQESSRESSRGLRSTHTPEGKENQEEGIYAVPEEAAVDCTCARCGEASMYRLDGYMCRVCGKVYHKPCLVKTGHYTPAEAKMIDRAFTNIGWSCHECDNITSLLTADEHSTVSNTFEEFDINKDCAVSQDEYLAYRRQQHRRVEGADMPESEEAFERVQFSLLDADGSGTVDYWEFMKHEATKILHRRDKEELVRLLTDREKRAARMVYDHFDTDKDGTIDAVETRRAFREWYSFADKINSGHSKNLDGPTLASHVIHNAHRDFSDEADENDDAFISWPEFLRSQAIYIISSRPNKAKVQQT